MNGREGELYGRIMSDCIVWWLKRFFEGSILMEAGSEGARSEDAWLLRYMGDTKDMMHGIQR